MYSTRGRHHDVELTMYERKVDVDMLNAVNSITCWLTFRASALRQSKEGILGKERVYMV